MAETIFDFVAEHLESHTDLEKLEARGTIRIALKEGGLDAHTVTRAQMLVVIEKVLPGELESRGVGDAASVCGAIATALKAAPADVDEAEDTSPEEVFRRLAGR